MSRTTELTQNKVNEAADDLYSQGIKPSPNNIREILGSGSFSTIKQMLDIWKDKQKEEESVFVPDTPDFAYRQVDKLHKELYLHNRRLLDNERQQLQLTRLEIEAEKAEMMHEINNLEASVSDLKGDLLQKDASICSLKREIENLQTKFDELHNSFNAQKVEIATLTEREKQQALQLTEKETMLKHADMLEKTLQKQIEELIAKDMVKNNFPTLPFLR